MGRTPVAVCAALALLAALHCSPGALAYEKTLRRIVRNQSKMVQRSFSEADAAAAAAPRPDVSVRHQVIGDSKLWYSGFAQRWPLFHRIQMPKISTAASPRRTSADRGHPAPRVAPEVGRLRAASAFFSDNSTREEARPAKQPPGGPTTEATRRVLVTSIFFPPVEAEDVQSAEQKVFSKENVVIPPERDASAEHNGTRVTAVVVPRGGRFGPPPHRGRAQLAVDANDTVDFLLEAAPGTDSSFTYNASGACSACAVCKSVPQLKADIDAQEMFLRFEIEPAWMSTSKFWNTVFDSRYVSLMRNPKWPPLKVVLVAQSVAAGVWRVPPGGAQAPAARVLSGAVKKLRYYDELRFAWGELAHLSRWWAGATGRTRASFRKLLKSGRLEITTGAWVEPDEATAHLFGLVHLLFEGHQWLKRHLKYRPTTAWLTGGVTHSPTMIYLLAACGISHVVFTNVHYSWEQFFAEYQYSDFVWVQSWDSGGPRATALNDELGRIGRERLPRHSALAHFVQFNSAGTAACGPDAALCAAEFDFARGGRDMHVDAFNVKAKAERLLEQYSKAGTLSSHNIVIAPLGGPDAYREQVEFDHQFNNYRKLAEYLNANKNIYKASVQFGTPKDYFAAALERQRDYPTLKGDFLNFADVKSGAPAYWAGTFTSRPFIKVLHRRLESALRSAEILLSFAVGANAFRSCDPGPLLKLLAKARETAALLTDRHVTSGTVTAAVAQYVRSLMLSTIKDCWHVQGVAASLLSAKSSKSNASYLRAYVYRDGEFMSDFRTVSPGDLIYVFNSLGHERTEIIELVSSSPNLRVVDHNKKDLTVQINPIWKYTADESISISRKSFGLAFGVTVAPMALELFTLKETQGATTGTAAAAVYCSRCTAEEAEAAGPFPFELRPIGAGDVQLENYNYRLIFDEVTGFLKTLVEKDTNAERIVSVDYGAFRASGAVAGMYVFSTNSTKPMDDPLRRYRLGVDAKSTIIVSGLVASEITSVFSRLLQHAVKIYNLVHGPLSKSVIIRSKVDYEATPKNRDLELFLFIQTDIWNGSPSRLYTDNNGFQLTARYLNMSRRVESNVYPMTTMAVIEDRRSRLTVVADHAQGVTSLREGQLVMMLDRRVLHDDGRGTGEGLADSALTAHTHVLLLERLEPLGERPAPPGAVVASASAVRLSHALNYPVNVFVADRTQPGLAYYAFLPMLKVAFPCDVAVLTYRLDLESAHSGSAAPNAAFMVLHRTGISCRISEPASTQCRGADAFEIGNVVRNVKSVFRTNLPGTTEGELAGQFDHTNFAPMELVTVRVHFSE